VQPEQPGPWEPKEALDPPALKEILVQPEQLVPKRCVDLRATPATPATPADQEQRELEDQPVVPAIPETLVILEPRARQDPRVIAVSKVYKEKPDCQAPLARLALRAQLVREVIQETPEIRVHGDRLVQRVIRGRQVILAEPVRPEPPEPLVRLVQEEILDPVVRKVL